MHLPSLLDAFGVVVSSSAGNGPWKLCCSAIGHCPRTGPEIEGDAPIVGVAGRAYPAA